MTKRTLILSLLMYLSGHHVLASKKAAVYQIMYYWSTYQMSIQVDGLQNAGQKQNAIAPKCPPPCYFDDFVNYLQRDGKKLDAGQATSVGKNPWPDPIKTAKELASLESNGVKFVPNPDPDRLFQSGWWTGSKTSNPSLQDILNKVTDNIRELRKVHGDNVPGIAKGLQEAKTALIAIHEARFSENTPDYIGEVNDFIRDKKGRSYAVNTCSPTAKDGTTYIDIDHQSTVASHPEFQQDFVDFKTWLDKQGKKGESRTARVKRHWDAIQGVEDCKRRVLGKPGC